MGMIRHKGLVTGHATEQKERLLATIARPGDRDSGDHGIISCHARKSSFDSITLRHDLASLFSSRSGRGRATDR